MSLLEHLSTSIFYIACGSFYSTIADPKVGGTYMSLAHSVGNLAGKFGEPMIMWLVGAIDVNESNLHKGQYNCDSSTLNQLGIEI